MLIMEGFKFIPNDVIYVEGALVDASKSIRDIDFYRNVFKNAGKRLVYLPEVMRYAMPNVEFEERTLYDAIIKQSGLDITGSGFIIVEKDGTLTFFDSNDSLGVLFDDVVGPRFGLFGGNIDKVEESNICYPEKLKDDSDGESSKSKILRIARPSFKSICCSFMAPSEPKDEIEELTAQVAVAIERLKQLGVDYATILNIVKGEPKLSRMVVTEVGRIILPDYNEMEIEMRPTAKALYLLYLKYADGIAFKDLPDYKDELMKIYAKVSNLSNGDAQREAVEALVDPFQNTINVTCSRVKEAFVSRFNNDLADYYVISGKRGEAKKIKLNRGLVDLRCTW
jgi:hypothetical protein